MKKNRAILFDRDGIVNIRPISDYIRKPDEFVMLEDFLSFFNKIKKNDYLAILITNQQGVGKKLMTLKDMMKIHDKMQNDLIKRTGYEFDDIFFCTELKESNSFRRKPNPGMLAEAIEKHDIDKSRSFMIGDSKSDIIAGKKAGVKTILLAPKYSDDDHGADLVYQNFYELTEDFEKNRIIT